MLGGIPMTRLSAAEAVSVTEKIRATADALVQEKSAETVGRPVIDACSALADAARPLADFDKKGFAIRRGIDTAADRCIGGIYSQCAAIINAYEQDVIPLEAAQSAELDAAKALDANLFADGTSFLSGRWIEQYGTTEMLLARAADPANAERIQQLGLKGRVDLLAKIHEQYGIEMGYTKGDSDDDATPLGLWHEALETFFAAVFFVHKRDSDLRTKLLAPYETASAAAREAHRKESKPSPTP